MDPGGKKISLGFELPALSDVLAEFFMNLADCGFLLPDVNCEHARQYLQVDILHKK